LLLSNCAALGFERTPPQAHRGFILGLYSFYTALAAYGIKPPVGTRRRSGSQ
jgi:hypothetical protein